MMGMGLASSVAAGSFVPTQVAGCTLWLRADMGITLNGSNVSAWADQSGKANNFAQGSAGNQPAFVASSTGGYPAILPDGSTSFLSSGTLTDAPTTMFAVAKATTQTATVRLVHITANGAANGLYCNTSTTMAALDSTTISVAVNATNPHIYGIAVNGASSKFYIDGSATTGTLSAGTTQAMFVGGFTGPVQVWDGPISELIFYNRLLSAAEISTVGRYLGRRYGITNTF